MDWTKYKAAFVDDGDGSLRDIYMLDCTLEDWAKTLQLIKRKDFQIRFELDGEESPLPADIDSIFKIRCEHNTLLRLNLEGVAINCHFFCVNEIESILILKKWFPSMNFKRLSDFYRAGALNSRRR